MKYKSMLEASVSAGHSISEGTLQKWSEEKVTSMIKGMENSYEERLKRQMISSRTLTSGSVEKKKVYKRGTEERVKLLLSLLRSTVAKTFSYYKYIK